MRSRALTGAAKVPAAPSAMLETEGAGAEGEGEVPRETVLLDAPPVAEAEAEARPELVMVMAAEVEFLPPKTIELLALVLVVVGGAVEMTSELVVEVEVAGGGV